MMNKTAAERYLAALRAQLGPVTVGEREEILREIGAHIRDSAEEPGSSVEAVLERLGTPEALAAEYRDSLLIRQASRSFSPLLQLRGALRLATKRFFGVVVFFCALFGYLIGGGLLLSGLLKPLLPGNTGVWMIGSHVVDSGTLFPVPVAPAREVLGYWYIPLALTAGALLVIATMWAIQLCLRTSKFCQSRLGAAGRHSAVAHWPAL